MKKYVILFLAIFSLCSCKWDKEEFNDVIVKLNNETDYTLVISNIDNGGDSRFYPESSITLNPYDTYSQTLKRISSNEPINIAPVSMTIEYNGQSINLNSEMDIKRNPCRAEDWIRYSNFSKFGSGVFFAFDIRKEDLENWVSR